MERASEDLGFEVVMVFPGGTLDNSERLGAGEFDGRFDATWFAANRYAELIGADDKLVGAEKIATSPVAFGVRAEKVRELGWDAEAPTWTETAEATSEGDLTIAMTDPGTSNSGFSALVSVATAMADTGNALTVEDVDRVTPQLRSLFEGQTLTSGSSGWLAETFRDDPARADAMVNYESVLHDLKSDGLDVEIIVPADGVVSADYPLSALAEPADLLIELPFPGSKDVTDRLVRAHHNELRTPGDTAFVLDTSGSMAGERLDSLQATLTSLVDGSARTSTSEVGFRDRERISLLPFSSQPGQSTTVRFSVTDPGPRGELLGAIDRLEPLGSTAIYGALIDAYDTIDVGGDAIPSIVLMTDGEVTDGPGLGEFIAHHRSLPKDRQSIPVFVILYGEANVGEMEELADATGGEVFDALDGDLDAAFKEIRGYQ